VASDRAKNFPEEARRQATALMASGCDWEGALGLMSLMRANDIAPNAINYGALMGTAKREFDREQGALKVLEVYDDMLRHEVRPNLLICTTVIAALGRRGRVDEAERVFRDMEGRGDVADVKAFGALMSAYAAKAEDLGTPVQERRTAADAVKRLYQELMGRGHGDQAHMLGLRVIALAQPARLGAVPRGEP
jgi:pentatricopeptide repeat protein